MAKCKDYKGPAIGIDLGTTFSCVSVYREGRAEIIVDINGDRLIPSIVYYDSSSGKVYVGKETYDEEPKCFGNCIKDVKRIIGRRYDDEFIKKYVNKRDLAFKLVNGENGDAVFEVQIGGESVKKTPEEVSAEILKYLKRMAQNFIDANISNVVITIPAYFSNGQRKATKKAAELAGLNVTRFITEPSAAGSYYIKDKIIDGNVLVFDWGGGTLDISFIKLKNKIFEVKAVYGDTQLGGRDLDHILFEQFYKSGLPDRSLRRLLNKCIDLKKKLSYSENTSVIIDSFNGKEDYELSITREAFEKLANDIFKAAMDIVDYGLYDVGWSQSDIDDVILVGGSTRIPKIRNLLKTHFSKEELKTDLNPDEAVAAGASLQAFRLQNYNEYIEKYKITEVTPLSIGLKVKDNLMATFIPRNSKLPCKYTQLMTTRTNDQKTALFEIIEGERKNCDFNNKLGEFEITDLPPNRACDVKFDVTFHLDEDGILTTSATERSTGKTEKLVVTMGEFRLSEKKVRMSVQDAKKMKYEDDTFSHFVSIKQNMKKYCYDIEYDIKKISDEKEQNLVKEACKNFIDEIVNLKFTEIVHLESLFATFNTKTSDILKKYNMLQLTNW